MALCKQLLPKKRKEPESLTGYDLTVYLIKNPNAKGNFRFNTLCSEEWYNLLSKRPEFIDRCDTAKITPNYAILLLLDQPQLRSYFSPDKFSWRDRLCIWPELIEKMPKNRRLTQHFWMLIVGHQPGLWDHSPKNFTSEQWAWIIWQQPQLADKCPWKDMIYPSAEIEEREITLKKFNPPRKKTVIVAKLRWKLCLLKYPDIVLAHRPDWKKYYNLNNFNSRHLADILCSNPKIVDEFPEDFNSDKWGSILYIFPQFVKYCDVKKYFSKTPLHLIVYHPELANFFDMDNIEENSCSSREIVDFIKFHPDWADKVLKYLDGDGWTDVLYYHPEYLLKREGWRYSFRNGVAAFVAAKVWDFERTGLDSICNCVYHWLIRTVSPPKKGLFHDAETLSPAEFLLKSVMDPDNAKRFLFWKLYRKEWDFLSKILDFDSDELSKLIKHSDIFFLLTAAAPQEFQKQFLESIPDPAACRDRNGNTLLHAALIRAVFADVRALLDSDNPYREQYDYLLKRGCDPDQKNKFGFSCNDLIDQIKQFINRKD